MGYVGVWFAEAKRQFSPGPPSGGNEARYFYNLWLEVVLRSFSQVALRKAYRLSI